MTSSKRRAKGAAVDSGDFTHAPARALLRNFRTLFGTMQAHFRLVESRCGIGGAQLWALSEVGASSEITVQQLADALIVHQSTASNLITRLADLGLIRRERARSDKRVVQLSITPKGRALLRRAPQPAIGVLPEALRRLSDRDAAQLEAGLKSLLSSIGRKQRGAGSLPMGGV
jgi:DNA-binding MarR family transcriptional regulator